MLRNYTKKIKLINYLKYINLKMNFINLLINYLFY